MSEVYTGEGLVTINNPGNSKIEIEISGNEKQATRDGKNFYNVRDYEGRNFNSTLLKIDDEDKISLEDYTNSSDTTKWIDFNTNISSKIKASTVYYVVTEIFSVSGSGKLTVVSTNATAPGQFATSVSYNFSALAAGDVKIAQITSREDLSNCVSMLRSFLQFTAGQGGSISFRVSVLEKSVTAEDFKYEKYGESPSFYYPSEVKAAGDNINIFDGEIEIGGINGQNGEKTSDSNTRRNKNPIEVEKYKNLIFSCDSQPVNINVYEYDKNNEFLKYTYLNEGKFIELNDNTHFINFSKSNTVDFTKIKIESGTKITNFSNYNQGCIELKVVNKNFLDIQKNATVEKSGMTFTTDENGILTINGTSTANIYLQLNAEGILDNNISRWKQTNFKKGNYVFSVHNLSDIRKNLNMSAFVRQTAYSTNYTDLLYFMQREKTYEQFSFEEDTDAVVYLWIHSDITLSNVKLKFQIELDESATDIVANEQQKYVVAVQQPMFSKDKFDLKKKKEIHNMKKVVLDGEYYVWNIKEIGSSGVVQFGVNLGFTAKENPFAISNYFRKSKDYSIVNTFVISSNLKTAFFHIPKDSITEVSTTALQNKLKELYDAGNPVTLWVEAETADELDLTPAQINILNQIENIELYEGINNITATSSIDPNLQVTVKKLVEDYNIYISEKGHLMIPEYNIDYLIDPNESNIPIMPEATESSVRAAGRDGDIVLNTTYEPIPFDIVCYTEDNLTQTEKLNAEKNINKFLNSIKNKTINIAFENNNTFYKVKYSGALVTTNYPKHLKFAIPLKSSDSYGKDLIQKSIVGNNTEESDTIEDVGALFIIRGPALNPIISLNDYSMEYTTSILEGASVEIDTSKSTITNVNNDGIRTNVMKYYNHQFPKIQNGINTLKILSGIDNDKNVIVTWNDLKL